jgi:hypothetical protein
MKNRKIILNTILITLVIITSCESSNSSDLNLTPTNQEQNSNESEKIGDPNSSPKTVMNTLFNAAKTGEVGVLRFLLPPNGACDGDCKAICNPGNESMREELGNNYIDLNRFKLDFSNGKIIGEPTINGNEATVNFVFGPNLEANETMYMQKIDGKWYLQSF